MAMRSYQAAIFSLTASLSALMVSSVSSFAVAQTAPAAPNSVPPIADNAPPAAIPNALGDNIATEEEAKSANVELPVVKEEIVVRGLKERKSSWKRIETEHVIMFSNGSESKLRQAAIDLEKLHFLMSKIFGRLNAVDDTKKLRITLIGKQAFMQSMRLTNSRSAEGPFTGPVQDQRYYDPRIDGAVMAVSRDNQKFSVSNSFASEQDSQLYEGSGDEGFDDDPSLSDFGDGGAVEIERPWEQALFAGFAQHYVTTHFPSAYPRWYIDAVGALFSTMTVRKNGNIEYGRAPPAFFDLYAQSKPIKIAEILITGEPGKNAIWSSHHAWLLAHFFFLSPTTQIRKQQLAQYMGAIAKGRRPEDAVKVFGDLNQLQKEIDTYANQRIRFAVVPGGNAPSDPPDIQAMSAAQAEILKWQLQIDARFILPELPSTDIAPDRAKKMKKLYDAARILRTEWMADLRKSVAQFPRNTDALLILAEAECRAGDFAACITVADRVIDQMPNDVSALSWKAIALVNQAAQEPQAVRRDRIIAARKLAVFANKSDPEAQLPLIAYFRSFTDAGDVAPEAALRGMLKVIQLVPNAPEPRLLLSQELIRQSRLGAANTILQPLLKGPWDSPERRAALQIVASQKTEALSPK